MMRANFPARISYSRLKKTVLLQNIEFLCDSKGGIFARLEMISQIFEYLLPVGRSVKWRGSGRKTLSNCRENLTNKPPQKKQLPGARTEAPPPSPEAGWEWEGGIKKSIMYYSLQGDKM